MVKLLLGRVTAARTKALRILEMCSGQLKLMSSKQPSVSGKNWGHAVLPPKVTFGAQYPPASQLQHQQLQYHCISRYPARSRH